MLVTPFHDDYRLNEDAPADAAELIRKRLPLLNEVI